MNKKAFELGFSHGVKVASSNPAAPVKGHDFGQPRVDMSMGAYLNTSGGAKAPKQVEGPVAKGVAPGQSMNTSPPAAGGPVAMDASPDTGERGKSDHGMLPQTKSAAWLTEMFGDVDNT
jgi:hypothetical protein